LRPLRTVRIGNGQAARPMSAPRTFPKCGVCGNHGHTDTKCALYELNRSQEYEVRMKGDINLGLTPALEAEIAKIRESWRIRA
jgi:hypothetical protein